MKRIILSLLVFATLSHASAQGVQSDIPTVVKNTFVTKFPKAVTPKWTHTKMTYEVQFMVGLSDHQATIDSLGNMVRHQYEISSRSLPKVVNDNITKNHLNAKIENTEQIDVGRTSTYVVQMRDASGVHKVTFNQEGKEISSK